MKSNISGEMLNKPFTPEFLNEKAKHVATGKYNMAHSFSIPQADANTCMKI